MKENNDKNQYASCLLKVPIFSHLDESEQEEIVDLIRVKKVKKGETLYNAGITNPNLYVVHNGKIKISRYNEEGDEQVIQVLMEGDFAGQQALFEDKVSEEFAISLEDATLCVLNGNELKEHILRKPTISFKMISELSKRLSDTENKMEQITLNSAEKRLANSILELSKGELSFTLPFSKADWASMLGMSQETLSRKLREYKEVDAIELNGQRGIKILDKKYLEDKF